jgi:CMP-N-acetylneuraminic acid synthetase
MNQVMGLVCHRAGSARLPYKAMQLLNGHPMAHYTFDALSQALPYTWLFTDDVALQGLAVRYPGIVPTPFDRPAAVSQALSTSLDTVKYVCQRLKPLPDWCLLVQVTSPGLRAAHIRQALAMLAAHPDADGLVSVVAPAKPPTWLMQANDMWMGNSPWPENRQAWLPNGAMYVFKPSAILAGQPLLSGRVLIYPMDDTPIHRLDIDTVADFYQARSMLRYNC